MIDFACDQCGKRFQVADSMAGKKGSCKQCGATLRIPAASEEEEVELFPVLDAPSRPPATKGPTKFCHHCGESIAKPAEICPKCGVRQHDVSAPAAKEARSKALAALFAMLLGGLGVHRFYLGQPWWGLLYLLLCWTFIPAIVAFVEGIMFLVMKDAEFQRKYGPA